MSAERLLVPCLKAPMYSLVAIRDIVLIPPIIHSVQYLANGVQAERACLC